jgi:hypothetical protein
MNNQSPTDPTIVELDLKSSQNLLNLSPVWANRHKFSIGIILFFALVALGSLYYLASVIASSPILEPVIHKTNHVSSTSTWKTYTNSQYGFEFKYPNKWSVQTTTDGLGLSDGNFDGLQGDVNNGSVYDMEIIVKDNSAQKSVEDFMKTYGAYNYPQYYKKDAVLANGIDSYELDGTASQNYHDPRGILFTFLPAHNRVYIAELKYSASLKDEYNQILSTFKFTE